MKTPETLELREAQLSRKPIHGVTYQGCRVGIERLFVHIEGERAFIQSIKVRKQRQGTGRQTVRELEALLAKRGVVHIEGTTLTSAKGFWTKMGYPYLPGSTTFKKKIN